MSAPSMDFPRTMGEQEALLWRMERNPLFRSTLLALAVLDRPPDRERLVAKLQRAGADLPRMRQRVAPLPEWISTPVWVRAPHFDMDYHLRWIGAPGDGSMRAVLDFAGSLAMQAFDPARPPWEFVVVEGLEGDGAAMLLKLHHSVTDGIGGVMLLRNFFDREREGPRPEPAGKKPAPEQAGVLRLSAEAALRGLSAGPGQLWRGASRLLGSARAPLDALRHAREDLASLGRMMAPVEGPLSPIMRERSTSFRFAHFAVSLSALRSASHAAGCKLSDAFLAAGAAGLRSYHQKHGAAVKALRVAVPVSRRDARGGTQVAGIEMAVARLALPIDEPDPARHMKLCRKLVRAQRDEPSQGYSDWFAGMLNRVPIPLALRMYGATALKNDFVASSVPGLPDRLYTAGARIESFQAFGPLSGAAVNLTLFSYGDAAHVSITVDHAAVPDLEVLVDSLKAGFEKVLKIAA